MLDVFMTLIELVGENMLKLIALFTIVACFAPLRVFGNVFKFAFVWTGLTGTSKPYGRSRCVRYVY